MGMTHCASVQDRLYNHRNTGKTDETMNPTLAQSLKRICPNNTIAQISIPLNSNTKHIYLVDNSFYKQILAGKGILQIDQDMALDPRTNKFVKELAEDNKAFLDKFSKAMVKMGAIEVLTGNQGEIRRSCRAFNES